MSLRAIAILLALAGSMLCGLANELQTMLFVQTPTPLPGELTQPRAISADQERQRFYLLDTGSERIIAMTPSGDEVGAWPFASVELSPQHLGLVADPMLPLVGIMTGGKSATLFTLDRQARTLDLVTIDGPTHGRTLTLPDGATWGAVGMDQAGRVLLAYLRAGGKPVLVIARESADGVFTEVCTLDDPADGETRNLNMTGFATASDGRVAIGIAQTGDQAYGFVRSWLVQATLKEDTIKEAPHITHRMAFLDSRGKPIDRFRANITLAGREGYPKKPCVPLFTALAFGPGEMMISGGHTSDPFLRTYTADGGLASSTPRVAAGGQHLASLRNNTDARLFAANPQSGQIDEFAATGHRLRTLGIAPSLSLAQPLSLAADADGLYVATRTRGTIALLRFAGDGRLQWVRQLTPPTGMVDALPVLAAPTDDRVLVGWRNPKAAGLAAVEMLMEDGTAGMPLWMDIYTGSKSTAQAGITPLVLGDDRKLYVLRETEKGSVSLIYSLTGIYLKNLPTAIRNVTYVTAAGRVGWAHWQEQSMVITLYGSDGNDLGWKRVPREVNEATTLQPVRAKGMCAWLSTTQSLLQLDDAFSVVDELALLTPQGMRVDNVIDITGDGAGRIYLALPDRILTAEMP